MSSKFERAFSGILAISAIAIAASVVSRTFFPQLSAQAPRADASVTPVKNWRDAFQIGVRTGPTAAPVTVVEFSDFECPGCKLFHAALRSVIAAYPRDVVDYYVYYPLVQHRFALGAARAAECAARAGRFTHWADAIFDKQDSLGLKSWASYASDAGIEDTVAIARCATDPAPVETIRRGLALGSKVGVQATPTVIINGYLLATPPDSTGLAEIVQSIHQGRDPFAGRVREQGGVIR